MVMLKTSLTAILVAEAMNSNYGWIYDRDSIAQAVEIMLNNTWNEALVLDQHKKLVGLVTKEHILRSLARGTPKNLPIRDICTRNLITTTPDVKLSEARDIMRQRRVGCLPVIDRQNRVVGILTAQDVCNGFSSKLENVGKHLQAIIENISEAVQVINCQGVVTFWNSAAEKMFGIKAIDIIGEPLTGMYHDPLLQQVVDTMEPRYGVVMELPGGKTVVRNAAPVVTATGEKIGVVCTTLDISTMKNLMEQLDLAKQRVNTIEQRAVHRYVKRQQSEEVFYTINAATKRLLEQALRISATEATVLILGESGTGKDLLANIIHYHSKRAAHHFVGINCSAVPEALFESEMFGYEPGTFTGASKTGKPGKFELARGGTIFLDEVGEMPLAMQAKLLRVIEDRQYFRVGGTTSMHADIRLIAATNRDLVKLVQKKRFREDLYYRLNVMTLVIPPLRERREDIPGLVERFIKKLAVCYDCPVSGIDADVMDLFTTYNWPGNVRQLRNVLERVVVLGNGERITMDSLAQAGVMEMFLAPGGSKTALSSNGSVSEDKQCSPTGPLFTCRKRTSMVMPAFSAHYSRMS